MSVPMKHLSLDALRAFTSVVDLNSYTAAGQQLGRSQPAISLQLQKLEEQLGARLLTRQRGRMQLTAAGEALYASARQLLNLNDRVFAQFQQPSLAGRVRLGIPSEFASTLLPRVLGQFAQSYPQVTLEVTSALSEQLLQQDDEHDYDVVVALQEPTQQVRKDDLLKQESLVWVVSSLMPPLAKNAPVSLVVAPDGCIYRRRALQALKKCQQAWRISYTNADFSGLKAVLHSGLGVTELADSAVPDNFTRLPSSKTINSASGSTALPELGRVNLVLKQRASDNPAASQLAVFLRERI